MWRQWKTPRRRRAVLLKLGVRPRLATESEKLPLLRSRHCALRLIYLEFELVRDESRNAFHHPLTRPLAAYADIAIIGVAQVAVAASL